jgi:hypothetical protein
VLLRFVVFGLLALLTGCASFAPVVTEPLRVGNVNDLPPEALYLLPQVSTIDEARALMSIRGLTGVVEDAYAAEGGRRVEVITADYQSRVHVFVSGRYHGSVKLPTGGLPPYGLALRLGSNGSSAFLLVLYRDPLARQEEPPTLLTYRWAKNQFELHGRTSFEALVTRHGGMNRPMLFGNDLSEGVLLVARDRHGALWDRSYLLRVAPATRISLKPQAMTESLRCSCVRAYAFGATSH